ncbi:MAG: MATE family efflux transporter [Lachnospiraceae bacterium]|nr:MATE family efflux transporter [Lachnospiraceae bacterium]
MENIDSNKVSEQYKKMTETPVKRLVITLAIPTILSMMVTSIYNIVDTAFVGTLGNSASGAVGIVFGLMAILQSVGFLFGQGSGSMLSRKLGSKDPQSASIIASTGFFCSFSLAVIIGSLCFIFIDPLIMLLGSTPTIAPYAKIYIYYILVSSPFIVSSFTLNNILRYEGKASLGMIGLLTGSILNIAGDALFIFKLDMGIAGAGLSTAISQVISFSLLLSMFLFGKTSSKLSVKNISIADKTLFDIVTTGFPSLLRQSLGSLATIVLNFVSGSYGGDEAVAAMSIVNRASFFLFAIALGIGQGFQPVCGFNYGAGKYRRLRVAYSFTLILSEIVLIVLTFLTLIFSGNIIQVFRDDPDVIMIGTRALRLLCVAQLFMPFCMVTEMLMQSSGQRTAASLLSSLRGGVLFIPALFILPKIRGLYGVQEAQPLAFILSVLPSLYFMQRFFKNLPKEEDHI